MAASTTPTEEEQGHSTTAKRLLRFVAKNAFDEPAARPPPATLGAKLAANIPGQPTAIEPSVAICNVPRGRVVIEDAELFGIAAGLELALHCLPATSGTVRIFVDAQAALRRLLDTGPGPGQWVVPRIARAEKAILDAGWTTEFRWTPGHKDVPGNEQADQLAKGAASSRSPSEVPEVLAATSLAYIARAGTEAKRQDRDRWLAQHCRPKNYYRMPRGRGSKAAFKTRKAVATRFFQLRLQKAPTAPYLHWTGRRADDKCWWCNSGAVQTRDHLFKFCKRWKNEQRTLWRRVSEATKEGGRKRWPATATAALLADDRCTEAILDFLGTTKVGSWPAGGIPC